MGETRGAGGDGREQWSATPPKPELKTSTPTSSRLAAPLRELRRLFPLSLAVAAGVALFITLIPGEVGMIPSLPQDGQKTQRGAFGPADLGFPSLAHSAPRILAAAPIEERVEKAGVEPDSGEDPDRRAGGNGGGSRDSEREDGNHNDSSQHGDTSSEGEPEREGQPVVAPPEEGVGAPPEPRPPPGQPPAEQASGQGNGNAGGNGNGNGNGQGNGNAGGNGNGQGNGNAGGNGNSGGNGNGQGNGNPGGNGGNGGIGGDESGSGEDDESGGEEGGSDDEGGDDGDEGDEGDN